MRNSKISKIIISNNLSRTTPIKILINKHQTALLDSLVVYKLQVLFLLRGKGSTQVT